MSKIKFKKGDKVKIISGKDKGREGKIEAILSKKSLALIPGLNIYKKHVKGSQGQKGGIYDVPRPFPFGKFVLICPKCNKPTRVGIKTVKNDKLRFCKKCKKEIDTK